MKSVLSIFYSETKLLNVLHFNESGPCVCNKLKEIRYWPLIFMNYGQHILNIYGQFLCRNGILTKIRTC